MPQKYTSLDWKKLIYKKFGNKIILDFYDEADPDSSMFTCSIHGAFVYSPHKAIHYSYYGCPKCSEVALKEANKRKRVPKSQFIKKLNLLNIEPLELHGFYAPAIFKCNVCNKEFSQKPARIWTWGSKPFGCSSCRKRNGKGPRFKNAEQYRAELEKISHNKITALFDYNLDTHKKVLKSCLGVISANMNG